MEIHTFWNDVLRLSSMCLWSYSLPTFNFKPIQLSNCEHWSRKAIYKPSLVRMYVWNRFVNTGKGVKKSRPTSRQLLKNLALLLVLCLLEKDIAAGDFLVTQCLLPVPIKCGKTGEGDKRNEISVFVTDTKGYSSKMCS